MAHPLTPLALGILSTLRDHPMHPYEIRQTMIERKHDEIIRMPGGSLYSTIDRLLADGHVAVVATEREGRRPERTVYDLTPEGEAALLVWLREALVTPAEDVPQLASVIAFLPHLMPAEAAGLLARRRLALQAKLSADGATMGDAFWSRVPRMFRLHREYRTTLWEAELEWVTGLVADIETGRLSWPPMIVAWHQRRGTWENAEPTDSNDRANKTGDRLS
jgi:DNA-binding PadR family transcriptional regulator